MLQVYNRVKCPSFILYLLSYMYPSSNYVDSVSVIYVCGRNVGKFKQTIGWHFPYWLNVCQMDIYNS